MILASIKDWFDWIPGDVLLLSLKWFVVVVLLVVGFLGTFLPLLPGTSLIYLGVLGHYFLMGMGESGLTILSLVVIGLIYIVTVIIDYASGAIGAKWFGSSKWGVWGAIIGGIVGIFIPFPGIIIAPILGVFLAEMWFAKKELGHAGKSTFGTVVGGITGTLVKMALAMVMVAWYVADVFFMN
jgi:uncharacterized protein YqgC (DUF456 family)